MNETEIIERERQVADDIAVILREFAKEMEEEEAARINSEELDRYYKGHGLSRPEFCEVCLSFACVCSKQRPLASPTDKSAQSLSRCDSD